MYGNLCTEFYDIDKKFSPPDEIAFYKRFLDKKNLILEPTWVKISTGRTAQYLAIA